MTARGLALNTDSKKTLRALQDKVQRYPYENISGIEEEHFWFVVRNERICDLVKLTLPNFESAKFLEIGSGTGNVLGYLQTNGLKNLTGFEIEDLGIEISRQRFPDISFEHCNILELDKSPQKFDAVGMFDCIEHFADDKVPLEKARELLHPGGKVYITVPAHDFLWSEIDELFGHYRRYTKKTLQKSLNASGFGNVEQFYFMAPLVPLAIIHRKLKNYPVPSTMTKAEINQLLERETSKPHDAINSIMLHLARLEHKMLRRNDLGFGGSILAVATLESG